MIPTVYNPNWTPAQIPSWQNIAPETRYLFSNASSQADWDAALARAADPLRLFVWSKLSAEHKALLLSASSRSEYEETARQIHLALAG